uniref:Putative F-box protein n=1 Tax=Noccaea caerulescens TaxID=107243 RepID=A0A1J3HTH7_NOCCA
MEDLPELILVNIFARFTLKNIARFRLLSRSWKSIIDSDFFRDHYISSNSSSSSSSVSWSIIQTRPHKLSLEIVGHHGCSRWGLDRSPASLMSFFAETAIKKLLVLSCTDGLVSIFAENVDGSPSYYIGNLLSREWFEIPLPSYSSVSSQNLHSLRKRNRFDDTGLVTKMEKGIVVSYKIVWTVKPDSSSDKLVLMIYSSDSGTWELKENVASSLQQHSTAVIGKSIPLNGTLHWLSQDTTTSCIVAYNFYDDDGDDDDDGFHIVHFPGKGDELRRFTRSFTTSEEYIVYFNEFNENENRIFRVWRLVKYEEGGSWELTWEINLFLSLVDLGKDYFPMVMHPLKSEIIYLWSRDKKGLVLFNLRTLVFSLHKELEDDEKNKSMDGCVLSFNGCREYLKAIYGYHLEMYQAFPNCLLFSQFVLPRWLHRLPRPLRA